MKINLNDNAKKMVSKVRYKYKIYSTLEPSQSLNLIVSFRQKGKLFRQKLGLDVISHREYSHFSFNDNVNEIIFNEEYTYNYISNSPSNVKFSHPL